jgi:hypothetical protein
MLKYKNFELTFISKSDSIGFHHLCKITKDNQLIKTFKQQWCNRTWEEYQFASIERRAKEFIDLITK